MLPMTESSAGRLGRGQRQVPIVSFVAPSGTGKTTYLEKLLPALAARGLRVLVIKHDVHGFEVDRPGKDTWRLRRAGAHGVLIANREQMALMAGQGPGYSGRLDAPERRRQFVHLLFNLRQSASICGLSFLVFFLSYSRLSACTREPACFI